MALEGKLLIIAIYAIFEVYCLKKQKQFIIGLFLMLGLELLLKIIERNRK